MILYFLLFLLEWTTAQAAVEKWINTWFWVMDTSMSICIHVAPGNGKILRSTSTTYANIKIILIKNFYLTSANSFFFCWHWLGQSKRKKHQNKFMVQKNYSFSQWCTECKKKPRKICVLVVPWLCTSKCTLLNLHLF